MFGGKKNAIYEKGAGCIKEYALHDDPNLKARPRMEDNFIIKDNFFNDGDVSLYGVLDGHGGQEVAIFAANNYPNVVFLLWLKRKKVND